MLPRGYQAMCLRGYVAVLLDGYIILLLRDVFGAGLNIAMQREFNVYQKKRLIRPFLANLGFFMCHISRSKLTNFLFYELREMLSAYSRSYVGN